MLSRLTAKIPKLKKRNTLNQRTSLSEVEAERVVEIIKSKTIPDLNLNQEAWARNRLILKLFLVTGIRRGELAGLKIQDIETRLEKLVVTRSPDDPEEFRKYEPATKTNDRELPLAHKLLTEIETYIFKHRQKIKGARSHPYLFVNIRNGKALSMQAINNVFRLLRTRESNIRKSFCPHELRHTFATAWVHKMDKDGIPPSQQDQSLSDAMGWKQGSGTASTYLRNHIKEQANTLLMKFQEDSFEIGDHDT